MSAPYGHCRVCEQPLPAPKNPKKGGRPRIHCGSDCALLDTRLRYILNEMYRLNRVATPAAQLFIRGELWRAGNAMIPDRGRRAETAYWWLHLECGHEVERKARRRPRDGVSTLDPTPTWTRCEHCERQARAVLGAILQHGEPDV